MTRKRARGESDAESGDDGSGYGSDGSRPPQPPASGVSEFARRSGEATRETREAIAGRVAELARAGAGSSAPARAPPSTSDLAVYRSLMDREPYESIYRGMRPREDGSAPSVPELPLVSKAYEDGYLREARAGAGERPCVAGDQCECVLMAERAPRRAQGFVCREFLLPEDEARWRRTNKPPAQRGLCLPCIRKQCMLWYYELVAADEDAKTLIQTHRNMVDVPGEYSSAACLYPHDRRFFGITDPIVEHQINRYAYVTLPDGSRGLRQTGVDFRERPTNR